MEEIVIKPGRFFCFAVVTIILSSFTVALSEQINLSTLLHDMIDREQIASFPEPPYQWTVLNPREGWWGEGDDIYVNDILKQTQDLYSNHEGVTNPTIDLGECEPVDNAFVVRFEFKGHHVNARAQANKYALGIDFFLIENNFLAR